MKDFDAERQQRHEQRERELGDRSFRLGGETFQFRANPSYTSMEPLMKVQDAEGIEIIRLMEQSILDLLEPGQQDRFLVALRNPDVPVTVFDLNEITNWITEAQTGRPTQAPSLSTPGGLTTSTESTENLSSLPDAVAAT
jgi:hypothetical protein